MRRKLIWPVAALVGLAAVAAMTVMNWDGVSGALETQSERAQTTLFRWGELMSIAARLQERYGIEPEVGYEVEFERRVLTVDFGEREAPAGTSGSDYARAIALAALEATERDEEIDVLRVMLDMPYTFDMRDLRPAATP